jgi:hypothetical protein
MLDMEGFTGGVGSKREVLLHVAVQPRGNHFWTAGKLCGVELPAPKSNENSAENNN